MKITLTILGFEVARLDLDLEFGDDEAPEAEALPPVVASAHRWWTRRGPR